VPIFMYAIEVIYVADPFARHQLRVAYNSVFRRIFGFHFYESVTDLQGQLSRPTWEAFVEKRSSSFLSDLRSSNNEVLRCLLTVVSGTG
jgi:hypothetical protein